MSDLRINFETDWTELLRQELVDAGYSVAPTDTPHDIGNKFFNAMRRRIPPQPRRVHVAQGFMCPSEHEPGLREIRRKVETGEDLTAHQSRRVLAADREDSLLNHWDVQHFHLGAATDPSGFVCRTDPLLFARVTTDDFYMIGLFSHGDWSKQSIVQTLHDNWPESIAAYRIHGAIGLEWKLSDDDVQILRSHGVLTPVQVTDSTVYAPIGGGYSTARTSIQVTMMSDQYLRKVADLEKWICENLVKLKAAARTQGVEIGPPFEFRLYVKNGYAYAVETRSKLAFRLCEL